MTFKQQLMQDMAVRLVERRKFLGWSQEKAAEEVDITQQTLSGAETAKTMLMPDTMLKLCKAYGISCDYLLTGKIADSDIIILDERVKQMDAETFLHYKAITEHYIEAVQANKEKEQG